MNAIWVFLVLNTINYICDYPLQNFFLAEWKQKNNYALFVHCFIWAMGVALGLQYYGLFEWWKLVMLFVGHFIVDGWKCRGYYKRLNLSDEASFYIDQGIHVLQIILCLIVY